MFASVCHRLETPSELDVVNSHRLSIIALLIISIVGLSKLFTMSLLNTWKSSPIQMKKLKEAWQKCAWKFMLPRTPCQQSSMILKEEEYTQLLSNILIWLHYMSKYYKKREVNSKATRADFQKVSKNCRIPMPKSQSWRLVLKKCNQNCKKRIKSLNEL